MASKSDIEADMENDSQKTKNLLASLIASFWSNFSCLQISSKAFSHFKNKKYGNQIKKLTWKLIFGL